MQRVIAIGAHPDDIELGCAGTLMRRVEEGCEVSVLVVTNGEAQEGVEWRKRIEESKQAASVLGVGIDFLGYEERCVCFEDHALVGKIRAKVTGFDAVYCHSTKDYHQTHSAVARATVGACMLARVPFVAAFEVPSTTTRFAPNSMVDITKFMERKLKALACFKSQIGRYYMLNEMVEGLARYRAYQARFIEVGEQLLSAEAFEIERMVVG